MQPVDAFIRAGEPSDACEVGVHDDAGDRCGVEGPGVTLDADVLEALRAVTGFEDRAVAGRDHDVGLERQRRIARGGERAVLDVRGVTSPSGSSHSPYVIVSLVPGRARGR